MTTITAADKLACVKRELKMRQSIYPRRVADGKMSSAAAEREIAVMLAIVLDYELLAAQIELPL